MGRCLKRVAMDFDWPLGKVWKGYINPHYKKCPEQGKTCFGGENAAACYLSHIVALLGVAADSALRGSTHPYLESLPYGSDHPDWSIQPQEIRDRMVNLVEYLDDQKASRLGFNGCTNVFFKLLDMTGIKNTHSSEKNPAYDWTHCLVCKGSGIDPAVQEAYHAWKQEEPPAGKGYQLWETTSEGTPQSPVFTTLDELCAYAENHCTTFGSAKTSADKWKEMLEKDFVCHTEGNVTFI